MPSPCKKTGTVLSGFASAFPAPKPLSEKSPSPGPIAKKAKWSDFDDMQSDHGEDSSVNQNEIENGNDTGSTSSDANEKGSSDANEKGSSDPGDYHFSSNENDNNGDVKGSAVEGDVDGDANSNINMLVTGHDKTTTTTARSEKPKWHVQNVDEDNINSVTNVDEYANHSASDTDLRIKIGTRIYNCHYDLLKEEIPALVYFLPADLGLFPNTNGSNSNSTSGSESPSFSSNTNSDTIHELSRHLPIICQENPALFETVLDFIYWGPDKSNFVIKRKSIFLLADLAKTLGMTPLYDRTQTALQLYIPCYPLQVYHQAEAELWCVPPELEQAVVAEMVEFFQSHTYTKERREEVIKLPLALQQQILFANDLGVASEDAVFIFVQAYWKTYENAYTSPGQLCPLWELVRWKCLSWPLLRDVSFNTSEKIPLEVQYGFFTPEFQSRLKSGKSRDPAPDSPFRNPTNRYGTPPAEQEAQLTNRMYIDLIVKTPEAGDLCRGGVCKAAQRAEKVYEGHGRMVVLPSPNDAMVGPEFLAEYRKKSTASSTSQQNSLFSSPGDSGWLSSVVSAPHIHNRLSFYCDYIAADTVTADAGSASTQKPMGLFTNVSGMCSDPNWPLDFKVCVCVRDSSHHRGRDTSSEIGQIIERTPKNQHQTSSGVLAPVLKWTVLGPYRITLPLRAGDGLQSSLSGDSSDLGKVRKRSDSWGLVSFNGMLETSVWIEKGKPAGRGPASPSRAPESMEGDDWN